MTPLFFATPAAWRRWLASHHKTEDQLWVGFRRKASGRPSITWPESVDEALCFGWIDGLRKRIDAESYMIRFTPRRPGSTWSANNVKRVKELSRRRRIRAAGTRAFAMRTPAKTGIYSFEQRKNVKLPAACVRLFKADADAWRFFKSRAPWYQRTATWWVISAKQEETKRRRLGILIEASALGRTIGPLTPKKPSQGHSRNSDSSS
jgi:uncharacterized protein YdeI (YjbR/CyaY-like superfamily)